MRCAVCGGTDLAPHLKVAGEAGSQGLIPTTDRFGTALSDIVRCRSCGHMQLEHMPAAEDLRESYAEAESEDYVAEEAGQRATAQGVLERIERHVPAAGRLLEIGSWVGFLLDEARRRGWEASGIEPSGFASAYARERLGLDVRRAELADAELAYGAYDAVVLGDVIEHLPDPGAALERIRPALVPGGALALTLPDAGSRVARAMGRRWWSVIPTHVHYFTRASLVRLLEGRGFRVLELRTAPKSFTVGYYLGRAGGYSPALGRGLVAGARALGVADRIWAPDFRDRMLAIASPRAGRDPGPGPGRPLQSNQEFPHGKEEQMALQIGETAPDFEAETTEGRIHFHDWIGDSWAILFSHPKDFTPVCTTELGYMAAIKPEFERRGVKIIGLSVDPVDKHSDWARDIEETQGHAPNYPIIADSDFNVSKLYGMLPASTEGDPGERTPADNQTVRNVVVVGPDKKVKLILVYPMTTGRNFDEVLRVIDSLQLTAKHKVATPVNWQQGDDVIIAGSVSDEEAKEAYPEGWESPRPYIRIVPQPR